MRHYETLYIISPVVSEEGYAGVIGKFKGLVEKEKGVVVSLEEWGSQRLAYRINKFDKGSYVLMEYCGESGITSELERDLKLDDRILKFQTVKIADKADPQELMEKKREVRTKNGEKKVEASEPEEDNPEQDAPQGDTNGVQ
jgi:small subunit ribosomal protein S6